MMRLTTLGALLLGAAALSVSGCHPGNLEARRLRESCAAGTVKACNDYGIKLVKGEYVLKDETTAAGMFERSCKASIADGCARVGVLYQNGRGVKKDSVRAAS